MGHGKVPWPFVRRSRFVRELQSQGDAYRLNVECAERDARNARNALCDKEALFQDTVQKLSGWNEPGGGQVVVDSDGPPQHFDIRVVRDLIGLRYTFVYDVSAAMLNRLRGIPSTNAGVVLWSVTEGLVRQAILTLYEDTAM